MKNRPLKHKTNNQFCFKSFRDRIKEIDVRRGALYRVETDYELPDTEEGTYFQQALKKWSVQNLTNEYEEFQRGFKESVTLPILLFNKDAIVEHLTACLQKATDSALEPLLDLLVALAKDLRKDFHCYFSDLFEVVVQFLHSTSADRIEWTLLCLAHLFKILRSFLRTDFSNTFNRLVQLLDEASSPPHAVDFATECLGYLARDLKDKRPLVDQLLKWQMKNDAYTVACGRLLFEIVNGVQDHFHITAKQTLMQLFEIMGQLDGTQADHLQEILTQTITDIVEGIEPTEIPIFWETMRVTIDGCIAKLDGNQSPDEKEHLVEHLTRLLQLNGIVLEYKDGRLLGDALPTTVSQSIKLLTTLSSPGDEFNETIVNQIIVLLRSKHIRLTQLDASRLTMNVLMLDHRPLYERFIAATAKCAVFEALIWPNFVKMLEADIDDARICFLAGLLLQKVPQCGNGLQLENWKPFPVQVVANGNVERYMNKVLAVEHVQMEYVLENFELYLGVLIVLPHLANYREQQKAVNALKDSITYAAETVETDSPIAHRTAAKIFQLVAVTVETIIHMDALEGKEYLDLVERILPLVTKQDCLLLNSIHLLITFVADQWKSLLTFKRFERLRPSVHPLLFSYDSSVRRLASDILVHFDHLQELAVAMGPLYGTIAQIESIEPLIQTYRGQVILFQHLAYDSQLCQQAANVARDEWTETVLQYMLSTFAVNFKLLWEPAAAIVQSYGDNMSKSDEVLFWRVFESMLSLAESKQPHMAEQQSVTLPATEGKDEQCEEQLEIEEADGESHGLLSTVLSCFLEKSNIDYQHVCVQLLRAMQRCSHFCRLKGDRIAERFLAFLESDRSSTKEDLADESVVVATAPATPSASVDHEIRRKSSKAAGAGTQKVLLCYLNICTELGRKSLRKQATRVYEVYETLVSSRNEDIQKAALNGIFSFGEPQLAPYKDFILRLTNDKTLKSTLVSVFIPLEDEPDADDEGVAAMAGRTKIAEEHRPKVVRLMLSVLDGKIIQNLGGSVAGGPVKATILTFIGRLRDDELEMLLRRWYDPYLRLLKDTPLATVQSLGENEYAAADTVPVPPPYRINVLLKMLSCIMTEVAPLQPAAFTARVLHLKILFDALLIRMDHSIYRKYKSHGLLSLVDVFKQYEDSYQWTDEELQAIMLVHVWPQLENLPRDSIHSPTPLLKLLLTWSKSERLYVLLERAHRTDPTSDRSLTPLAAMIELLQGSQTSGSVCTEIFTALATMLECETEKEEGRSGKKVAHQPEATTVEQQLSHRNRLLIPYVKQLLQYIRHSLKTKKQISSNLLLILTRIAESGMIGSDQQNEECIENDRHSLLSLLFPILLRKVSTSNKNANDHATANHDVRRLHVIIMRLLMEVKFPQQYLKQLAQLLEAVRDVASRKTLMQIYTNLAPISEELQLIATLVNQLNAMSKRWVDQPDQATRMAAYRYIEPLLAPDAPAGQRMTGNVAIMFLSQARHVLQYEKELGARQNATDYVCKVVTYLATTTNDDGSVQYCIERIVMRGITDGLKVKRTDSDRRTEAIQLLAQLSRQVGALQGKARPECRLFTELWHFTALADGDPERDFFENVTHLQVYNHRKALKRLALKLAKLAAKGGAAAAAATEDADVPERKGVPSARTVVQFLLPIVSHYIGNEAYKQQTNLVEEAGNCIITLCRFLPWRSYHTILQQYLKRLKYSLEYQKQLLRIVIGIMDGFHFDLSAAALPADDGAEDPKEAAAPGVNALMDKKLVLPTDETEGTADEAMDEAEEQEAAAEEKEPEEKMDVEGENGEDNEEDEDEAPGMEQQGTLEEEEKQQRKVRDARKLARTIVDDISRTIIPSLLSSFKFSLEGPVSVSGAGMSQADKKARYAKQREEMLKLPIAIAIVKLFIKLPRQEIEQNLPKLIIKVITFLKSRLKQVRAQARNTLAHITLELGPSYLSFILQNLLAMLTRGFQRHVLTFTVHTIIDRAQKHLAGGHVLGDILQTVLQICMEDVFGQLIGLINGTTVEGGSLRKDSTPEAKSSRKPYQTLHLLARHASEPMLVDLIAPFRAVLVKFRTHQTVAKVQDAFRRLAEGFVLNKTIAPEGLLTFVYGMLSGQVYAQCALANGEEAPVEDRYAASGRKLLGKVAKPGSIYLIPAEPKRYGSTANASNLDYNLAKTEGNDHVFVESGLDLLLQFIKHQLADVSRQNRELLRERIDPIVPLMVRMLNSKHSRIICHAVDCIGVLWGSRWQLASFDNKETMDTIVKAIFSTLHRYNTIALNVNNPNFAMVKSSFRAVVNLLKYMKNVYTPKPEQLRLLVLYIEQDIAIGGGRQSQAFVLLRTIINRRCNFPELHELMRKVFETAVRSEIDTVRAECRLITVEYIINYPMGKKLEGHLLFFVDQLQYEVLFGRESAAHVLNSLFQKLAKESIDKHHNVLVFALGIRLVNEEMSEQRTLVAECIETLLKRLETNQKCEELLPILMQMLSDGQLKHRELATQLLLRLMHSEPTVAFARKWLAKVQDALLLNLVPQMSSDPLGHPCTGMFVKQTVPLKTLVHGDTRGDHLIIQTLNVFEKLLQIFPRIFADKRYDHMLDSLAYTAQTLLASGHRWVRLGALKVLFHVMNELDFDVIHEKVRTVSENRRPEADEDGEEDDDGTETGKQFFYRSPLRDSKSLTLDLCAQLTPGSGMVDEGDDEAAAIVTQILFLVANVLRAVPLPEDPASASSKKINLYWLLRRVRYVIQSEVLKTPRLYTLRKHALHWMSSVVSILEQDKLEQLAPALLIPAVRELTAQESSKRRTKAAETDPVRVSLHKVATKLCKDMSIRLGSATYDKIRNTLEESLRTKRIGRKVTLAQEKITQPLIAARRKENKKLRGKESRKRKSESRSEGSGPKERMNGEGVLLGVKRRAKSSKRGGTPKKRSKMEAMFKE